MAISSFYYVTIEFAGAAPFAGNTQSGIRLSNRDIRLVESNADSSRSFILQDGDAPEYKLSDEETTKLDQLLGQLKVKAPWQASAGFDGANFELSLLGALSSMTFCWWMDVPAEWEGVGAVFDYVMALADGYHKGES
jgi:hypothetical protein